MFRFFRSLRPCLAALALTVLPFTLSSAALADSYLVTVVSHSQHENFFGIDTNGDFVLNLSADSVNPCGINMTPCFETFYVGQPIPIVSTSAPALAYDDGTPCSPILFPGFSPQGGNHGICNNGHAIVGGSDAQHPIGVWDGPDPIANLLLIGSFDGGSMNAKGDAVFIDGFNDTLVSAFDLTTATPEPSSFILLGTGCLSMLGAFRRFTRHVDQV
jgi:hypothetical protein